jgi:hypothetical protein
LGAHSRTRQEQGQSRHDPSPEDRANAGAGVSRYRRNFPAGAGGMSLALIPVAAEPNGFHKFDLVSSAFAPSENNDSFARQSGFTTASGLGCVWA